MSYSFLPEFRYLGGIELKIYNRSSSIKLDLFDDSDEKDTLF